MRKRDKKKQQTQLLTRNMIEETDKDISWILIILIAVLPLLVRAHAGEFIAPGIVSNVVNTGLKVDVFSYYKWIFLICASALLTAMLVLKMLAYHYQLCKSYANLPVILMVLFLLLSLFFSETKGIALVGLYTQYNGTLTYLCFLALLIVAANTTYKEWFSKYITIALGIFVVINVTINLFHFYGYDLYQAGVLNSLIFPSHFNLEGAPSGTIWATLENPNYVSGLAAALFAYSLGFVLLETKIIRIILYMLLASASFALLLGSLSTSGFVSILIISPVIIAIAYLSQSKKHTLIAAGGTILLCIVIFIGMNNYNPRVYNETFGFFPKALSSNFMVKEVYAAENNKTNVESQIQQDHFQLPKPQISAGSGRGYIWAKTLELIKQRPFFGYGQDTLTYYFPHNDVNKIAGMGTYKTITSKPHNMYLGIAYGSGIPALLVLLALLGLHFYHTFRNLLTMQSNKERIFPAALFLFFCAFIIQWLFNDAVLGSATIFWVLMGIGIALNTTSQQATKE